MLNKLATMALLAGALTGFSGQAQAETKLREVWIKDLSTSGPFSTPPRINVESEDGTYTRVVPGSITQFPIHVHAVIKNTSKKYKILYAYVYPNAVLGKGPVPGTAMNVLPLSANQQYFTENPRKLDKETYLSLTGDELKRAGFGWRAVKACQDAVSAGKSPFQPHTTSIRVRLSFRVKAGKTSGFGPASPDEVVKKAHSVKVKAQVNCLPSKAPPVATADDFEFDHGEFKVKDIELFLSTFSGATTSPNPATTCKKGRVLVRLKASKAGNTKFQLWTKVGDAAMTSKVVDAWASFDGNSGYEAEHIEWVSVDKTTTVQAKAEEMVGAIGKSTAWKDITLQCSDTGGGGFAPEMPDQPQAPKLSLKGDFTFIDNGAPKCTRQGKALVSFKTNKSGNIHYSLDCTNGQHLSGVAQTVKSPQGGFVAAAMQTFDISNTTVYSCALKTVAPGPVKLHQWKSHKFDCVNRAVETGSNDIQVAPKPTDAQPRNPRVPATLIPNALDKAKADAIKRRLEAAKKAQADAAAKRKREAAAQRVKAAKKKAEAEAAAKRKREAAIAAEKRKAAAKALAKRKTAAKVARKRKTSSNNTRTRVMRLR